MRKNLLLVVLVFSMVLFFSKIGFAQTNDFYFDPISLEIHPCVGGGTVVLDLRVTTINDVQSLSANLVFRGTANPKLDTILTGGLASVTVWAFEPWDGILSLVDGWASRIVNPYPYCVPYPPADPQRFVATSFAGPIPAGSDGRFARMWITVDGPGSLVIETMPHSVSGNSFMVDPGGAVLPINWPASGVVDSFEVARTPEQAPVVDCPAYLEYFAGDLVPINISATDAGGTDIQGIFLQGALPCGSGGFSGSNPWVYDWNTVGCAEGIYTLTFGVYDECETTYCDTDVKIVETVGFVRIANVLDGEPCELVEVPVLLLPTVEMGAFDFYIEFDPTLLYFQGAERGPGLPEGWEFFTYRQLPCPMCGCCKYKLQIFGLYDIKDKHQGEPLPVSEEYLEIATLKFKIACDEWLRGYELNICFEFDDETCTENTASDVTGNILYASDNPDFFNFEDCPVQDHGDNPVINKLHFDLFAPPGTENPEGRPCGGVLVRDTYKERGDINLNHLAYEPADLTLFSSYFIFGDKVFIIDKSEQIAATDINADGYPLSLSDFILMIRIMLHDATPIPKATPGSDLATIYATTAGSETKVSTSADLGAALFVFEGEGKVVNSDLKYEQGIVDGQLRVLVYMNSSQGISGELFTVEGTAKFSVEAVDNYGRSINATVVYRAIPTAFALHPNYPNPFNPATNFAFALPVDCKVSLKIYNLAGQMVRTLVNETMLAGHHTVTWDGTNSNGEKVASGVYFYKLNAGEFSKTMKMVMTK